MDTREYLFKLLDLVKVDGFALSPEHTEESIINDVSKDKKFSFNLDQMQIDIATLNVSETNFHEIVGNNPIVTFHKEILFDHLIENKLIERKPAQSKITSQGTSIEPSIPDNGNKKDTDKIVRSA
jgi:hypothetical protein